MAPGRLSNVLMQVCANTETEKWWCNDITKESLQRQFEASPYNQINVLWNKNDERQRFFLARPL